MDKSASVVAALNAGKLPSTQQIDQRIESLLSSPLLNPDRIDDSGELSQQGKVLQKDVRDVLIAYKQLVETKNGDNVVQESIWHLSEADISSTSTSMEVDSDQAHEDSRAIARSLRKLVSVLWENLSQEGRSVLHDFASFMRLAIADVADHVAHGASVTAESLRDLDEQVEEGERTELGMKKRKAENDAEDTDVRVKFEKTMDSTKEAGSKAIVAGQVVAATTHETAARASTRLQDAFYKVCDRAQSDSEYHTAINTLFDLAHKWIHRSLDAAGDVNRGTSLEEFIYDPTPDKHLISGIRGFRTVLERLAGGKSLDDFFGAIRVCGVDIQQDEELRKWSDEFITHLRKCVDESGYVRSEEAKQKREQLRKEWKGLLDTDTEKGQQWKGDFHRLKEEVSAFQSAVDHDDCLRKMRRAHEKLGDDLEDSILVVGRAGMQTTMEKAPWLWQDLFNVYLPRAVDMLKDIPIPRTEYKDKEVEFVLEDLDISSFGLLPGHAYIRNIMDIDIQATSAGQADTAVGALTRIYVQALQLQLEEVSFYYKDKTATVGPAEFTGILEFTLPPQGVDVDVVVRTIPNSPEGLKERERRNRFLEIQRVEVRISDDVNLSVKESNHQILVSVFKPVMLSRFRDALSTVIAEQIRASLDGLDGMAWDVGRRAEVFGDAGLGRGASLAAGFWSELGHLRKGEGGLLSGWIATGTGVIKKDKDTQFAMGAEPQVLSGEKHGPKGTFSESVGERFELDKKREQALEHAQGVTEQVKEGAKKSVRKVRSFKDSVRAKFEEEQRRPGWESSAFDV